MAHNDFVREDGQWPPESVPTARDWALFDRAQSKGLNIDRGRTWAPATPLILGGAGLTLAGGSITGGLRTESGGRLVLGDDDYVGFATRTRTVGIALGGSPRSSAAVPTWTRSSDPLGIRITKVSTVALTVPIPTRRLHQLATLASVVLRFRVGQPHPVVPAVLPRINVRQLTYGHTSSVSLASTGAAVLTTPATPDAYFAKGAGRAITFVANQHQLIDRGYFTYVVDITDESGTGALPGNVFHSLELHFTNITDLRPE